VKTTITTSGQLGPLLKHLRMEKGWSQAALGAKIGLSQERISHIESRPESVTVNHLLTLLMALDAALAVEPRTSPVKRGESPTSAIIGPGPGPDDRETW
jgi:HTH-type transcriptional regulator/antitoxin HipB